MESYKFLEQEYLDLLELAFEATESLKGKVVADGRKPDSQYLAVKLFAHAATAHWLYKCTKSPVPMTRKGSNFIDFSSIAVLARSALETYLTFFEVFVSPKSSDEFEFNYCLWHLSGQVVRENLVPLDPSLNEDYRSAQEDIKTLRDRITATATFQGLGSKAKKDALKGRRKRDWLLVAKSAGFAYEFIRRIYAYYSGFVHADGFTAGQLMSAQTKEDQLFHAEIHLITIMILLSKFILDYGQLFEEVQAIFPKFKKAYARAIFWSDIAKNLS